MGPTFIAVPRRRATCWPRTTPQRDRRRGGQVLEARRRAASATTKRGCAGVADVLGPLLLRRRPSVGSRRPKDLLEQLRLAWGMRGLDVRGHGRRHPPVHHEHPPTCSTEWFESPEVKGVLAINGIIGTWAGPEEPGTAYVMMHHTIGDVGDGHLGPLGLPDRRHGRGVRRDPPLGRVVRRRGAHRRRRSSASWSQNGQVVGVALADGARAAAPTPSSPPRTRRSRSCARSTAASCPTTSSPTSSDWRSRSGTVKVNVALSELPDFIADPGTEPHERLTGAVELCHSIDYLEQAFQDAREGRAAARPFSDGVIPSTLDPTLCPEGTHVMSLFTQWVPHDVVRRAAHRGARGVRRPGHRRLQRARAELQAVDHPPPGDRAVRDGARVRPDRRQHLPRRALARPAVPHAARRRATPTSPRRSTGLYQCSSATHGGGGVTGIPALLCTPAHPRRDRKARSDSLRRGATMTLP